MFVALAYSRCCCRCRYHRCDRPVAEFATSCFLVRNLTNTFTNAVAQVTGTSCSSGMVYGYNADGSVRCRADQRVQPGACASDRVMLGVSSSGGVVCSSYPVQRRVSGTCAGGYSIRTISQAGGVSCEQDTVGDTKTRVWSGYCGYHSTGRGWATYCHNAVERDTMGSTHLRRESESWCTACFVTAACNSVNVSWLGVVVLGVRGGDRRCSHGLG